MHRHLAKISVTVAALLAPLPAAAQKPGVAAPPACVNCAAAAQAQSKGANAAAMSVTPESKDDALKPYKGPRTVPASIARRAALLALLCGRKPTEMKR